MEDHTLAEPLLVRENNGGGFLREEKHQRKSRRLKQKQDKETIKQNKKKRNWKSTREDDQPLKGFGLIYKKESKVRKIVSVTFFAFVCLALEAIVTALIIVATYNTDLEYAVGYSNTLFQWHPILGSIAVCIVLSQSLIMYPALPWLPKWIIRILHGINGLTWLCLVIAALAIVVQSKVEIGDTHFGSMHERLGLIVIVLSGMQALVGLIKATTQFAWHRHFLHWHGKMGTIIYVLALVVVGSGVETLFDDTDEHTTYSNVIYVFLTLLAFFVILFEAIAKGGNLIPRLSVEDPIDIEEVEEGEEEREHNGMAVSWRSEATLEPQPFQRLL